MHTTTPNFLIEAVVSKKLFFWTWKKEKCDMNWKRYMKLYWKNTLLSENKCCGYCKAFWRNAIAICLEVSTNISWETPVAEQQILLLNCSLHWS